MKNIKLVKKDIIEFPSEYFSLQSSSFEKKLESIVLPKEDEENIIKQHTKNVIRDKVLGSFKIGELVNTIISWNEDIDNDIKEAKKEFLLAEYINKNQKNEYAIEELKSFLTNPVGNTLFNKILRILDNTPPDKELASHLSKALDFIIKSDFEKLFEQHKYALSQIEQLTPQALTILSDYKNFPLISLGTYTATGSRITSDWLEEFSVVYVKSKKIYDDMIINRVRNSINELISKRLIESYLLGEKQAKCNLTTLGNEIIPYII